MIDLRQGDFFNEIKGFADKTVDVVFTSPPYNRKRNDKYAEYDDTIEDYYKFLCDATDELLRVCKKYVIINLQKNYYNKKEVFKYIGTYADNITEIVIWEKTNPLPASGFSITNAYEMFIVLSKTPLKSNTTYTKNVITTSVNSETTTKEHRAVMKQDVSDWFIEKFTKDGDIVLDCFMGTGTTGVSCRKYNRDFIGIEICEKYFNRAEERIKKAV